MEGLNQTGDQTSVVLVEPPQTAVSIFGMAPSQLIKAVTAAATELANIIKTKGLSKAFGNGANAKDHVYVEGWNCMGSMLGVFARERQVTENDHGDFVAYVDLVHLQSGKTLGGASAMCGSDEPNWRSKPRYARRSMAITRATSKAYKQNFSWVMVMAGYQPTPAEEMEGLAKVNTGKPTTVNLPTATPTVNVQVQNQNGEPPKKKYIPRPGKKISEAQLGLLFGKAKEHSVSIAQVDSYIAAKWGLTSKKELDECQMDETITAMKNGNMALAIDIDKVFP